MFPEVQQGTSVLLALPVRSYACFGLQITQMNCNGDDDIFRFQSIPMRGIARSKKSGEEGTLIRALQTMVDVHSKQKVTDHKVDKGLTKGLIPCHQQTLIRLRTDKRDKSSAAGYLSKHHTIRAVNQLKIQKN